MALDDSSPDYGSAPGRPKSSRRQSNLAAGLALLAFLPWLMFSLVVCLFAFVFEDFAPMVWALVLSCIALSVLLGGLYVISRRLAHLALGTLCLTACCSGVLLGLYVQESFFSEHSRLERGAKYHNVQPAEPATSHSDAAVITFSAGSQIDTPHAVGYKKSVDEVYCVAPILDGTETGTTVEYWAIGKNCCLERGDFECHDARNPNARGGIAYDNTMADQADYSQAVQEVEAAFGLSSAKGAMFIRWVLDPLTVADELWSTGIYLIVGAASIYLVACIIVTILLKPLLADKPNANDDKQGFMR